LIFCNIMLQVGIWRDSRRVTTCRVLIKFKLDYLQSNFKNYGIYQET
jgi:hypothetical protein